MGYLRYSVATDLSTVTDCAKIPVLVGRLWCDSHPVTPAGTTTPSDDHHHDAPSTILLITSAPVSTLKSRGVRISDMVTGLFYSLVSDLALDRCRQFGWSRGGTYTLVRATNTKESRRTTPSVYYETTSSI